MHALPESIVRSVPPPSLALSVLLETEIRPRAGSLAAWAQEHALTPAQVVARVRRGSRDDAVVGALAEDLGLSREALARVVAAAA